MQGGRLKMADIARLAGVSRATASYVLNGQAQQRRISAETVARVQEVAERNGFRIHAQAAALRRGSSRALGLIVPDLENPSYARLAKLLERGARERGYQLLIAGSDDHPDSERELALTLRARGCDALIVASSLPQDDGLYAGIADNGMPVVALDRRMDPHRFVSVVSDDRQAACDLTRAVLAPSVRSVVWLNARPELAVSQERSRGFRDAVGRRRLQVHELVGDQYDREEGDKLVRGLLQDEALPDALVAASYSLLQGALDAFLACGDGLLQHLRLGTFGDDSMLDFMPVAIHSTAQQHERIATRVLWHVMEALEGRYSPGLDTIPRQLHKR